MVLYIKWGEMILKKTCMVLLFNSLFAHTLFSQTLIQQIENAYNALDSISYNENIIQSFRKYVEELHKEMDNTTLHIRGIDYSNMSSIQRQNIIDNIFGKTMYTQSQIENRINDFLSAFNDNSNPLYVLNLIFEQHEQHSFFQPDTSNLPFNLFYLDRRNNFRFHVLVEDGKYSYHGNLWFTFSRQIARNFPRALRRIMRKNPKYLLFCAELEGANSLMYVLDDKIFVYRIAQMQEYELNDYLEKFPPR